MFPEANILVVGTHGTHLNLKKTRIIIKTGNTGTRHHENTDQADDDVNTNVIYNIGDISFKKIRFKVNNIQINHI